MNEQTQPGRGRPPIAGETAGAHIHIRTTLKRKLAYMRAAKPRKLTDWITDKLDASAGYKPEQDPPNPKTPG